MLGWDEVTLSFAERNEAIIQSGIEMDWTWNSYQRIQTSCKETRVAWNARGFGAPDLES